MYNLLVNNFVSHENFGGNSDLDISDGKKFYNIEFWCSICFQCGPNGLHGLDHTL